MTSSPATSTTPGPTRSRRIHPWSAPGATVLLALSSVVSELTPLIAPWHLLTTSNWRMIWQGQFAVSIQNTAEIALVGAVITTAVVALAPAAAHRSAFRLRRSLPFMLLFPRAMPGLIIGIGFFWTFLLVNPPGNALRSSIWGIMLALDHARVLRDVFGVRDDQ